MKEKYLYNYSFDEFVKTIKHYCNLLYLSKNLIVFKYMISILTILLLHTNNLYAQAKLTDTVSILRSASFDKECVKKCENDPIELDIKEVGFIEWYVSGEKYHVKDDCSYNDYKVNNKRGILNDKSLNISFGCYNSYCPRTDISLVLDPQYSKIFMIASLKIQGRYCYYTEKMWAYDVKCVLGGFYENVLFSLSGSKLEWDKKDCYLRGNLDIDNIDNYVYVESKSVPEQLKTQKDKICKKTRNLCKESCSRYNMYIGNKEIKTVGDLLDSIPATELLKVYDPNMVYQ